MPQSDTLEQSLNFPIFLIGFMGSGKTTVGKKLSKASNLPFTDLDQLIVEQSGMDISDYFSKYGEDSFRKLETDILQSIPHNHGKIVSTGGGTPCFNNNLQWMNERGITIYLQLPPKALLKRLSGKEVKSRPLLQGKSEEEILAFITSKLEERESFYKGAKLIIDAHNTNPTQVLNLITTKLRSK
jgi:shikimate kinase